MDVLEWCQGLKAQIAEPPIPTASAENTNDHESERRAYIRRRLLKIVAAKAACQLGTPT
jgi:hypothetical protein